MTADIVPLMPSRAPSNRIYSAHMSGRPKKTFVALLLLFSAFETAHVAVADPVRINVAEGIISPFWDPWISDFSAWRVDPGDAHGLRVWQNWAAVDMEWARPAEEGPVLRMQREYDADVTEYDTLLVQATIPEGAQLRLFAQTDAGPREQTYTAAASEPNEFRLALDGAARLTSLTIEVNSASPNGGAGWFEWIGVQQADLLDAYQRRWDYSGMSWEQHVKPTDESVSYEPKYGIFLTPEELASLRNEHEEAFRANGASRFTGLKETVASMDFQAGIHEFAGSGGNTKGRMRDAELAPLSGGSRLAEAALVLHDRELMTAAAHYALSLAASQYWDKDFRSHFPGGPADDRAFRRSYSCEDIAIILDLAGDVFTPAGERYLLRRLAEEGVGPINYVTWRHDYIHVTNQLAYFNRGRMFAYLVLERTYPRVRPYTDLALQDTIDNIENAILPDGGYQEGPTYFGALARRNYDIIKKYARAREIDIETMVPDRLRKTADYAETMSSTTTDDVIPVGDSGRMLGYETLEAMVDLMPDSFWQTMLNEKRIRDGKSPGTIPGPPRRPFVHLPNLGMAASHRMLGDSIVKLLICGNAAGADHAHEDKGSFVLEYGGEAFAMDVGSAESYSDPIHNLFKQCQRHNMLVPTGFDERPAPPIRLDADVLPECRGDAKTFWAQMDLRPGWERYYRKWTRTWDSPSPNTFIITDEYELERGSGVEFFWQTMLPCRASGNTIEILGESATVRMTAPTDTTIRMQALPVADGKEQIRIGIAKAGTSGALRVAVEIQPNSR